MLNVENYIRFVKYLNPMIASSGLALMRGKCLLCALYFVDFVSRTVVGRARRDVFHKSASGICKFNYRLINPRVVNGF